MLLTISSGFSRYNHVSIVYNIEGAKGSKKAVIELILEIDATINDHPLVTREFKMRITFIKKEVSWSGENYTSYGDRTTKTSNTVKKSGGDDFGRGNYR